MQATAKRIGFRDNYTLYWIGPEQGDHKLSLGQGGGKAVASFVDAKKTARLAEDRATANVAGEKTTQMWPTARMANNGLCVFA